MLRLVYAPKCYAFIESTTQNRVINITDYITSGWVHRVHDAVSTASLTLRNPNKIWTGGIDNSRLAVFHPMDKACIFFEKVPGVPLEVFTGFLDSAPTYQMYPGTIELDMSCTLKRLLYTYWDPALPFVIEFLSQYGWISDGNGNLTNYTALAQGSDTINSYNKNVAKDVSNAQNNVDVTVSILPTTGSSGSVYLDYGATTSYGQTTNTIAFTDFNAGVTAPISFTLNNLSLDSTYHYRTEFQYTGSPSFVPGSDQNVSTGGAQTAPAFQLNDSSLSNVLYAVLKDIAGWSDDSIFIEALPSGLPERLLTLYQNLAENESVVMAQLQNFLNNLMGAGSMGSATGTASAGNPGGTTGGGTPTSTQTIVEDMTKIANSYSLPPLFVLNTSYSETNWQNITVATPNGGALGWFQFLFGNQPTYTPYPGGQSYTQAQAVQIDTATNAFCQYAAQTASKFNGGSQIAPVPQSQWEAWASYTQGNPAGYPNWDANLTVVTGYYNTYINNQPASDATKNSLWGPDQPLDPFAPSPTNTKTVSATNKGGDTNDTSAQSSSGYTMPLTTMPTSYTVTGPTFGGLDQGVILLSGKIGDPVYSMTPGTFYVNNGSGPTSNSKGNQYGTAYPVIQVSDGPWKGRAVFYGYVQANDALTPGQSISAGDVIGNIVYKGTNQNSGGGALDIGFFTGNYTTQPYPWVPGDDPTPDAETMYQALQSLASRQTLAVSSPYAATGIANSSTAANLQSLGTSAAFNTIFNFPSIENTEVALLLTGQKSYMNDVSILPFIQQLTQGCLRSFQSMPNGNLFIFFPDYFGSFTDTKPYWAINDIELLDGSITVSDQALATHVFVSGDTIVANAGTVSPFDQVASTGVVTIENAGISNIIKKGTPVNNTKNKTVGAAAGSVLGDDAQILSTPQDILNFLQRYGVRPLVEDMPMIHSHYFELFMAYQLFQLMWARQFLSTFTFTFMPELYPGGIVAFPAHGIAMYIDEVYHSFDYTQGFTTQANLMAPAALNENDSIPFTNGLALQGPLSSPNPGSP